MSADEEAQSVKPHSQATNEGVDIELSEEAIASLASYFDVLIQMDCQAPALANTLFRSFFGLRRVLA